MAIKCKTKLSDKCGSTVSSSCVDYVGDLYPTNTSLDPDDCNTVTDIIEDIINIVDQHTEDLDFSDFGDCLDYEASDEERGITLKDVLSKHEEKICDHEERIQKLEEGCSGSSDCKSCEDGCEETTGCCNILKQYDSLSQELLINQNAWTNSTNNSLTYKASKTGTYKIVVEIAETSSVLTNQNAFIGISLNGFDPLNDLYSQCKISHKHTKTLNFITKMKFNDTLRLSYKKGTTDYSLEYVKMFVEKVK